MPRPLMRLLARVDRPSVVQTLQCFIQCFSILLLHLFVDRNWWIPARVQYQMCLPSRCINAPIPLAESARAHTHTHGCSADRAVHVLYDSEHYRLASKNMGGSKNTDGVHNRVWPSRDAYLLLNHTDFPPSHRLTPHAVWTLICACPPSYNARLGYGPPLRGAPLSTLRRAPLERSKQPLTCNRWRLPSHRLRFLVACTPSDIAQPPPVTVQSPSVSRTLHLNRRRTSLELWPAPPPSPLLNKGAPCTLAWRSPACVHAHTHRHAVRCRRKMAIPHVEQVVFAQKEGQREVMPSLARCLAVVQPRT